MNYEEMSYNDLRKLARERGIPMQGSPNKAAIITYLQDYDKNKDEEIEELAKEIEKEPDKFVSPYHTKVNEIEKQAETSKLTPGQLAARARKEAMKTKVITIIDNDTRVNNQATSVSVNCSNEYFDLGTMVLPLNTPVEVPVGFINVLEEIEIPIHVRDPRTGLNRVEIRKRFTIKYEDKYALEKKANN